MFVSLKLNHFLLVCSNGLKEFSSPLNFDIDDD